MEVQEITARPKAATKLPPSPALAEQQQQKQQTNGVRAGDQVQPTATAGPKPATVPAPKPRLNIKDFQFKQCKGVVKVKAPG